jgi:peptidoglycan-associated lipoprotein
MFRIYVERIRFYAAPKKILFLIRGGLIMKNFVFILSLLLAGFISAGCSPQKVVQPTPSDQQQQEQQQQPTVSTKESETKTADIKPSERITERQLAKIEMKEDVRSDHYKEMKDLFEDIYFDYDEYEISAAARAVLEKISTWMLINRAAKISIEGHCDERGTNEYNLALGDRRAKAVRDVLIALGVPSGRIEMISYGEEKPLCSEKTDACYAKNRRAHFVILKEAGK